MTEIVYFYHPEDEILASWYIFEFSGRGELINLPVLQIKKKNLHVLPYFRWRIKDSSKNTNYHQVSSFVSVFIAVYCSISSWSIWYNAMTGIWSSMGSSLQSDGVNHSRSIRVSVPCQTDLFLRSCLSTRHCLSGESQILKTQLNSHISMNNILRIRRLNSTLSREP